MRFLGRPDPDDTTYWRMKAHAVKQPATRAQLQARRAVHVAKLRTVLEQARQYREDGGGKISNLMFWSAMTWAGNLRAEIRGAA